MSKARLNVTIDPVVASLLKDHERYDTKSQSELIEVAVLAYCNRQAALQSAGDIQKIKEDVKELVMQEMSVRIEQLKAELGVQSFNDARTAVDQYIEEIEAAKKA